MVQGQKSEDNYSSVLEKNSPDSPWLMFYFMRENALLDLTDVSGRMDQMNSVYIMILFYAG
jgi:hypothetical protein